jgi:mycothiol synthase
VADRPGTAPIVTLVSQCSEPAGQPTSGRAPADLADQSPLVEISNALTAGEVAAVTMLTEAATETDGVRPLSEHVSLHLRYGGEGPDRHVLVLLPGPADGVPADGAGGSGSRPGLATPTGGLTTPTGELATPTGEIVVGYAHLDPTDVVAGAAAELVVHPAFRGRGYGRLLVEAAHEQAPDGRLRLWAHGDRPAARRLAESMGFRVVRRLERLRRSLYSPLPGLHLPETVRVRAFRPGEDDAAWLALNARAFAGHPEQGSWTERDLAARMCETWFDPEGFLIAEEDGPDGPQMVAFHWTKVHGSDHGPALRVSGVHGRTAREAAARDDGPHGDGPATGARGGDGPHGHEPIGEVYVVGVDPAHQGRGLGRSITVAGLRWLRARGLPEAMLYVEADNEPALAVYRSLGFTRWDTDVMFYRATSTGRRRTEPVVRRAPRACRPALNPRE